MADPGVGIRRIDVDVDGSIRSDPLCQQPFQTYLSASYQHPVWLLSHQPFLQHLPIFLLIPISDMPTFPKPKEGDFPRLASPEGPPWLGLRDRKF